MSPNSRGDASTTSVTVPEIAEYALNPRKPGRVSDLAWGIVLAWGMVLAWGAVASSMRCRVLHEVSHLEVMNSPSLPEHSSLRGTNPYRKTAGDSSTLQRKEDETIFSAEQQHLTRKGECISSPLGRANLYVPYSVGRKH